MKKYKNLIFDCDGTLLDSNEATVGAFDAFARLMINRGLTEKEADDIFHASSEQSVINLGIPTTTANMLKLQELFDANSGSIKFFDGVEDVLAILKDKNINMGVATNRSEGETLIAMNANGIGKYIDKFTCRDYGENPKPSGDMLKYYLKKHNLKKDETLMLGNAIADHLAAIDAGIDYAYCMWGTKLKHDAEAIEIEKPEEILNLV